MTVPLPNNNSNAEPKPNKISKEEAEKLNNFSQSLTDEITDVVDYGELGEK
ncbi:hypothetical protein N9C44_01125 [bacterium]|jgi:hypothetical protein|nr:hypothetical protein [bacterium]|tara:strand:+ start:789 stop:941 length:153 start_codon:yes stop_codon:yes gene_type:complete